MHWKETLIKSIKWEPPKLTQKDDGNLDFTFKLPLTRLFQDQARQAFFTGIAEALSFCADAQREGKPITVPMLRAKMKEWGVKLPRKTKPPGAEETDEKGT